MQPLLCVSVVTIVFVGQIGGAVSFSLLSSAPQRGFALAPSGSIPSLAAVQRRGSLAPRFQTPLGLTMAVEPGSAASDYLKKIPAHLQGLAVRKRKTEVTEYTAAPVDENDDLAKIQQELDEYENENFDLAMEILEMEDVDVSKFTGDIDDATLLRDLKNKMDPEDFAHIFGRGVGELL